MPKGQPCCPSVCSFQFSQSTTAALIQLTSKANYICMLHEMMLAVLQVGMRLWQAICLEWRGRERERLFSHQYFPSLFPGGIKPTQRMYGTASYLRKTKKQKTPNKQQQQKLYIYLYISELNYFT